MSRLQVLGILLLALVLAVLVFHRPLTVDRYEMEGVIAVEEPPRVAFDNQSFDFGLINPDMNVSKTVRISNDGGVSRRFSLDFKGNITPYVTPERRSGILNPGEKVSIRLIFGGHEPGAYRGTLIIEQRRLLPLVRTNK